MSSRPKRKVSGFDDFAFDGKGGDVLIPLADDDHVSIGIRTAIGAEKPVSQIVLTNEEALKVMAEWWEFISDDGINVAAKIQEYRRLWREKNTVTIHSPRVSFEGPATPLSEGGSEIVCLECGGKAVSPFEQFCVPCCERLAFEHCKSKKQEPVIVKPKTTPVSFEVSEGMEDVFPEIVRKGPTPEPVEVKDASEFVERFGFMTSEQWNEKVPVGTKVRYWPIKGDKAYRDSVTRSEAWDLGHGQPVVKIEGQAGGVALNHLCVLPD